MFLTKSISLMVAEIQGWDTQIDRHTDTQTHRLNETQRDRNRGRIRDIQGQKQARKRTDGQAGRKGQGLRKLQLVCYRLNMKA